MNLLSLTLLATGGILVYSAVKGYDPRDVVRAALNGQSIANTQAKYVLPTSPAYSPTTASTPGASGV